MSFKSFYKCFIVIWICYYIVFFIGLYRTTQSLEILTYKNAYMGKTGAVGLVKNYYIKIIDTSDRQLRLIKKSSNISRPYGLFTLSKFLIPMKSINAIKRVTVYGLKSYTGVIHFAASAGNLKASKARLYIDVFSYLTYKCLLINVGFLIAFAFLRDIYEFIFKTKVRSNMYPSDNRNLFLNISYFLMVFTLLASFI